MSKLFNHTTQPLGSSTSPVEDLALEVAEAFDKIEESYNVEPRLMTEFRNSIGNLSFDAIEPHKVSKTFSETHNLTDTESSFTLRALPEQDSLSVSYQDLVSGSSITLTEISPSSNFTDKLQFKIEGKVVKTSLAVDKGSSQKVSVEYRGETFALGGRKFLPNVFKDSNGNFKFKPENLGLNKYQIVLDKDLNSFSDHFKNTPGDEVKLFYTEDGIDWLPVDSQSHRILGTNLEFVAPNFSPTSETYVAAFVNNTSIADLLNVLYKEFIDHNHNSQDLSQNIDSYTLLNRVVPSRKIYYKTDSLPNYQFPQYLNREGHNPSLDAVYENALLGNLFISREMVDGSDRFKGLDKDSNKIVFGDPSVGHYLKYSNEHKSLLLATVENNNGLKIQALDPNKWVLSLNKTEIKSNDLGVRVKPESGILDISSESANKNTLKTDHFESSGKTILNEVVIKNFSVNKVNMKASENGVDAEVVPLPTTGIGAKLYFKLPVVMKTFTTEEFKVLSGNFDKLKIGEGFLEKDEEDNLKIYTENDKKIILNSIKINNGEISSIKFGDVEFKHNTEDGLNNLNIISSVPESTFHVKAKTVLENVDIVQGRVKDTLFFGDVTLKPTEDNDLQVGEEESSSKVIFNSPVEFKNLTTDKNAKIGLATLNGEEIVVGNNKIVKEEENTFVKPVNDQVETEFVLESKTRLKRAVAEDITIENGTLKSIKIGKSTLHTDDQGNVSIIPEDVSSNKITVRTPTTLVKGKASNFEVEQDLTLNNAKGNSLRIGDVTLQNSDENIQIVSENDKKLLIKAEAVLDKATVKNLTITGGSFTNVTASGLKVGNIDFSKETGTESLLVTRTDNESEFKVEVPSKFSNLTATVFNTTGESHMGDLTADKLTINEMTFESTDENNIRISKPDGKEKILTWAIKSIFTDLIANRITAPVYSLHNKDKIELDAGNYITNINNRLTVVNDKPVNFIGSNKTSGISFSHEQGAEATARAYISANAGTVAVPTEKNLYIEANTTNGIYFLKDTNTKIIKDGVQFGFNDTTAQRVVSDLTKWFRSDIYVGNMEGYNLNLKTSEDGNRNGLSIGSTRLSVIGPGTACPEGLTILESGDVIHFVQPMASDSSGCRDLTYQEVSMGALNAKGNVAIEGVLTVSEDLITTGAIAASELAITSEAEFNSVKIAGELTVGDKTSFNSEVEFRNPLILRNEIKSDSKIVSKHLEVEENATFGRDVEVERDLDIGRSVAIGGGLVSKTGISTDGIVKSNGLETTEFNADSGRIHTNLDINGNIQVLGSAQFNNQVRLSSTLDVAADIITKSNVTANNLYSIREAYVRGQLSVKDGAVVEGKVITLGAEDSLITMNGKLQFNTSEVTLNSPLKVFNSMTLSGDLDNSGKLINKAGIEADSYVKIAGALNVSSTAEFTSEVKMRTLSIDQTMSVAGSLVANSLTSESLVIDNLASIKNLNVTESLVTSNNTRLTAGEAYFSSLNIRDPKSESIFSGRVFVSGELEVLNPVKIADKLVIGSDNLTLSNAGLNTPDGKVEARLLRVEEIKGKVKVQPTSEMLSSKERVVNQITNVIPTREFVKIDNCLIEGIAIFNNPVVVDTLIFNDLIYMGTKKDAEQGLKGLDILSRRALYS